LTGRYVLPAGVQETTTHVIDLIHDARARGARLQITGVVNGHVHYSDAETRSLIYRAMSRSDPTDAHIVVRLRLACGSPVLQALSVKHGFYVRDLPGLQHVQDGRCLTLMESSIGGRGLLLFAFNAEETDGTKEDYLLAWILTLLAKRRADPRSLVFLLNRADAFNRDLDPGKSLREAIAARQTRVFRIMRAAFHRAIVHPPTIIPLAAGPVFATEALFCRPHLDPTDWPALAQSVKNFAIPLLPDLLQEALPRSVAKWTRQERAAVCAAMRDVSGLNAMIKALAAYRLGVGEAR
jgi:hypothetical protein